MKKQLKSDVEYIRASLYWDADYKDVYDLDLSAFLLNKDGMAERDENFIFYNNAFSVNGALVYGGDNRTGEGEGFDETILVRLSLIPKDISRVVFCATINDEQSRLMFGNIKNANFIVSAVKDEYDKDGTNLISINLSNDHVKSSAMVVCELTRSGSLWKLDVLCDNVRGGLTELCERFGLEVE